MATLEAHLEALKALQAQTAAESLNPNGSQVANAAYQFGYVCGIQQGLRMAEELLNKQLEDTEETDNGNNARRHSQNRRR